MSERADGELADRARVLAVVRLHEVWDTEGFDQADPVTLAADITRQAQGRRELDPALTAALHLAALAGFFISEGYGGLDVVEESMEGETAAVAHESGAELCRRLQVTASELEPLAGQFGSRIADRKASWRNAPGYCYRLRELAGEAAALCAVALARNTPSR